MPGATPLPKRGEVFFDYRRTDRTLRLSPHPDAGVVVLSIWNGGVCQATFQLPGDQVELFTETLRVTSPPPGTPPGEPGPAAFRTGLPEGLRAEPAEPYHPEVYRTGQYDTQPNIA